MDYRVNLFTKILSDLIMIQPEELMKNSYVYLKGTKEIFQVCLIHENHFACRDLKGNFYPRGEYEPIELTPEILIRLGFEKWDNVVCNMYEYFERYVLHNEVEGTSNYEVHIIHSSYGGQNQIDYVTSIDQDERQYNWRMEYVHDLQRSFYNSTGKQLTLKEE